MVETLLKRNQTDPNLAGKKSLAPLILAASSTQKDAEQIIRRVVDAGANKHVVDENRSTALHFAASQGLSATILCLVEQQLDVQARSSKYGTILSAYMRNPAFSPGVAGLLLNTGACIDEMGGRHHSSLQAACARGTIGAVS